MGLCIETNVELASRTTLELGGPASHFASVRDESALVEALAWARSRGLGVFVLGGGSNVLVPDGGVDGLVIDLQLRGVELTDRGAQVLVRAAAGEPWDELVARSCDAGLVGIECLSGIPGRVGATPIQNVGAYGQEVADVITQVRTLNRASGEIAWLPASECGFGYRDSRFKRAPAAAIVLEVEYALRRDVAVVPRYAELAAALADAGGSGPADVRRVVLALRRAKSMVIDASDENRRSAGSFFTNPVVAVEVADAVFERAGELGPRWPQADGRMKLAAGWLIERAGITRGLRRGNVGVSSKHALALVHHGGGTTAELLALADEIVGAVRERFGVTLEREPVLLGG